MSGRVVYFRWRAPFCPTRMLSSVRATCGQSVSLTMFSSSVSPSSNFHDIMYMMLATQRFIRITRRSSDSRTPNQMSWYGLMQVAYRLHETFDDTHLLLFGPGTLSHGSAAVRLLTNPLVDQSLHA